MSLNPLLYLKAISSLRLRVLSWGLRVAGGAVLVVAIAVPFGARWQQALKIASAGGASLLVAGGRLSSHGAKQKHEFERVLHEQSLANFAAALKPPKEMEDAIATSDAPLPIFDWQRFQTESHKFPHVLLIAPTGAGKTTIAEWLLSLLPGQAKVITTKRKTKQWRGLEVIGTPRNFGAIAAELRALVLTMTARTERLDDLEADDQLNVAIDEIPAIAANCDGAIDDVLTLVREAREACMRLLILSQGKGVRTLGIEGQSDLLDCLCMVRLGKFATKHCEQLIRSKELPPHALDWLKAQPRPAMVDDEPANVPDLTHWVPQPREPGERATLEPAQNKDGTDLEPDKPDPLEPPSEAIILQVMRLHGEGKPMGEIISEVWGVSRGGSRKYQAARELYKSIVEG